jgi:hypothetical protein
VRDLTACVADETSAPPAARASRASQPAGRSGAVAGAGENKPGRPVAKLAPGLKTRVQGLAGSGKPPFTRNRAPACAHPDLRVVDDLPRPVPVGRAELDVLEMYLGPALDALLRAMKP